jgi:hypothetical protein
MSDNENTSDTQHLIDEMNRIVSSKSRRVGTKERTLVGEYISEAYAGGYLSDEEMHVRQDAAAAAKFGHDLRSITDDLPSYAELKGRQNIPVKTQKKVFWLRNFYNKCPVLSVAVTLVTGLFIAIVPAVTFASMFPGKNVPFPFSGFQAATITLGVALAVSAVIRFIYLIADDDSVLYKQYPG